MWSRHRTDRPLHGSESVARVLDPAFGLLVWAVHLLAVYIAAALACQLGAGNAGPGTRTLLLSALVAVTLIADVAVLLHAARRRRQARAQDLTDFRLSLTLGLDALAAISIAWQLFPILLAPLCR